MGCTRSRPVVSVSVLDRDSGAQRQETVPAYLRAIYRVMYQNPLGRKLIKNRLTTGMLRRATARHGVRMAATRSAQEIPAFIATYGVNVEEIERPLEEYDSFNAFFIRRLKPTSRPIDSAPNSLVSPADCRLLVFPSIAASTSIWLKGQDFTLAQLLSPAFQHLLPHFEHCSIAILRLAPQDYHRWHMPVDSTVLQRASVAGTYYSVSPRAVRQVNVLCTNKREVCLFQSPHIGVWALIAIGAAMVSSMVIPSKEGDRLHKGAEHGYFQLGGSTLILLFPKHTMLWDEDLLSNSQQPIETYVKMGTRIAQINTVHTDTHARRTRTSVPSALTPLRAAAAAAAEGEAAACVCPSPSPSSPSLIHTALRSSELAEAALNDVGDEDHVPVWQSNLTTRARHGDEVEEEEGTLLPWTQPPVADKHTRTVEVRHADEKKKNVRKGRRGRSSSRAPVAAKRQKGAEGAVLYKLVPATPRQDEDEDDGDVNMSSSPRAAVPSRSHTPQRHAAAPDAGTPRQARTCTAFVFPASTRKKRNRSD